jgi:transcriptional regulator with XRE-family HTH domain
VLSQILFARGPGAQQQLADDIGFDKRRLSQIAGGSIPTEEEAEKIAAALGRRVEEVFPAPEQQVA